MVDLNEFSSIFWKVQHSHSRQQTTSNLLRITLKSRLRINNEQSLEGALYINLWGNYQEPLNKFCSLQISIKNITRLLEFIKPNNKTKPIRKFVFTFYQNYTLETYNNPSLKPMDSFGTWRKLKIKYFFWFMHNFIELYELLMPC